jgi:hypothetical protein
LRVTSDPPVDAHTAARRPIRQQRPHDPDTARLVLLLDQAITAFRAGEGTGVHALDLASRLMGERELADDPIWRDTTQRSVRGPIPRRPDRVELAVLSALAGTYGADLLTNAALGYALRLIARHGGIAFVQRVLWGASASDLQLAEMLKTSRAALVQVSLAFSDAFLADANDVLAGFRTPPPARPTPTDDSHD